MKSILKIVLFVAILFFGFKMFAIFAQKALFLGILSLAVFIAYKLLWKSK